MQVGDQRGMDHEAILSVPGVTSLHLQALEQAGLDSWSELAYQSPDTVHKATGILPSEARKLIQESRKRGYDIQFQSSRAILEARQRIARISTSSRNLNELLGGGIECGAMTEVFGEAGAGKTQLCHQLAFNVALSAQHGGFGQHVFYIDTEEIYRPERLETMMAARNLQDDSLHERIHVLKARSSYHQVESVRRIRAPEGGSIGLILVDSVVAHFQVDYSADDMMRRQQDLNRHLMDLKQAAAKHQCAAVITNQVHGVQDSHTGARSTARGGPTVMHASQYRLELTRGRKDHRTGALRKAPHLPDGEAAFRVTDAGVAD